MPLLFSHDAKTKDHQTDSSAAAKQPAFQAMTHQQSQTKRHQTATMQVISPAHKLHPRNQSMPMNSQKEKNLPDNTEGS
jgi:hypothetical protein